MRHQWFRLASLIVFAIMLLPQTAQLPLAAPQVASGTVAVQTVELQSLTLQTRLQLVGQIRTIRGFYSNKSVPLIVDDINRMNVREPLPPGSYILLSGTIPTTVHHGDRLEVRGVIARPTTADPEHLRGEETILKLETATDAIKVISLSLIKPIPAISLTTTQQLVTASSKYKIALVPKVGIVLPTHYAVLINGGINPPNYWVSFYNDLVVSYNMLIGRGYLPANITVINANGGGAPPGTAPCGHVPVNYAATAANVTSVFTQLATKMKSQDTLTVMITDHGGTGLICLWGQNMSGATFGNLVNGINNYSQMIFSFDICRSASLIPNVRGVNRLILAACDADKSAYDSSLGHYGALTCSFVSAMTGMTPTGAAANADANADSRISLAEAFNWCRVHVNSGGSQTFHYNDDTTPPDAIGALPQGTDGVLGATRFL